MSGIMIKLAPEVFTVEFESVKAPCPGCLFYSADSEGPKSCGKASKPLSSALVAQCGDEGWRAESATSAVPPEEDIWGQTMVDT